MNNAWTKRLDLLDSTGKLRARATNAPSTPDDTWQIHYYHPGTGDAILDVRAAVLPTWEMVDDYLRAMTITRDREAIANDHG